MWCPVAFHHQRLLNSSRRPPATSSAGVERDKVARRQLRPLICRKPNRQFRRVWPRPLAELFLCRRVWRGQMPNCALTSSLRNGLMRHTIRSDERGGDPAPPPPPPPAGGGGGPRRGAGAWLPHLYSLYNSSPSRCQAYDTAVALPRSILPPWRISCGAPGVNLRLDVLPVCCRAVPCHRDLRVCLVGHAEHPVPAVLCNRARVQGGTAGAAAAVQVTDVPVKAVIDETQWGDLLKWVALGGGGVRGGKARERAGRWRCLGG